MTREMDEVASRSLGREGGGDWSLKRIEEGGDRDIYGGCRKIVAGRWELGHNQMGFQSPTKPIELAKNKQSLEDLRGGG